MKVTISDYAKLKSFVVIIARGNWVIYRNSIVRVECRNVLEKFSSSNSVSKIKLCIESTFGFLKFAANRLRVVTKVKNEVTPVRLQARIASVDTTKSCQFLLIISVVVKNAD